MTLFARVSPQAEHWGDFDCGDARITAKLVREAERAQSGLQALYGITENDVVQAVMTLRAGHLSAPGEVLAQLGQGEVDVPTLHIEVLAVRRDQQGRGFGTTLVRAAVNLGYGIAGQIGLKTVSLEATEQSKAFYEQLGLSAADFPWSDGSWAMWVVLDEAPW